MDKDRLEKLKLRARRATEIADLIERIDRQNIGSMAAILERNTTNGLSKLEWIELMTAGKEIVSKRCMATIEDLVAVEPEPDPQHEPEPIKEELTSC